jgi:DNA-binding NtrC family response regulator
MDAKTARILVVEDDPDGLRSVSEAIADAGYEVLPATSVEDAWTRFRREKPDVVLTDLVLPGADGLDLLARIRATSDPVPVLLMTAHSSVETAVQALKNGAYDYLVKPLDLDDLQARLSRAVETSRLRNENTALHRELSERYAPRTLVAASSRMQDVLRKIEAVASTAVTVLITGESGVGKELVARALHADGARAQRPFVALNCGAFTETLLESELFGHEKGAFTGAVARHPGAFERADGGTLFLDEIGLAPRPVQIRLLRALEEREVLRVGGLAPVPVDVRVIAASNRDLRELVRTAVFLPDLLYRLQVVTIAVPPLRERPEDIRPLAERFAAQAARDHGRTVERLAPDYFEALFAHPWPGNVRELRNVVESSVILARGPILTRADLALDLADGHPSTGGNSWPPPGMTLAQIEKEVLRRSLARTGANRTQVARELDVSLRTVQRKIHEYGLCERKEGEA